MAYRFVVALLFSFVVFPFAAMYTFAYTYEDAHFAFDRATWARGMFPIAVGWIVFLLPGMLPLLGKRYYSWVGRKLGFDVFAQRISEGYAGLRNRIQVTRARLSKPKSANPVHESQPMARKRRNGKELLRAAKEKLERITAPLTEGEQGAQKRKRPIVSREVIDKGAKQLDVGLKRLKDFQKVAKTHLTPDERQKRIDLNGYTLNVMSHLSSVARQKLTELKLDDVDRAFCMNALSAIPTTAVLNIPEEELQHMDQAFPYPRDRWESLTRAAARNSATLRDSTFQDAADGDIESALMIMRCIVDEYCQPESQTNTPEEDVILGLPVAEPA